MDRKETKYQSKVMVYDNPHVYCHGYSTRIIESNNALFIENG